MTRGESLALAYADFDEDGIDEGVQLFTSGRGVRVASHKDASVWWEFNGARAFDGLGPLPRFGAIPPRVWLRSGTPDSLFLLFLDAASGAPVDTTCFRAAEFGPGDPFHPRTGKFDAGALPFGYVELADGRPGLTIEFRCGRNLRRGSPQAWLLRSRRLQRQRLQFHSPESVTIIHS